MPFYIRCTKYDDSGFTELNNVSFDFFSCTCVLNMWNIYNVLLVILKEALPPNIINYRSVKQSLTCFSSKIPLPQCLHFLWSHKNISRKWDGQPSNLKTRYTQRSWLQLTNNMKLPLLFLGAVCCCSRIQPQEHLGEILKSHDTMSS